MKPGRLTLYRAVGNVKASRMHFAEERKLPQRNTETRGEERDMFWVRSRLCGCASAAFAGWAWAGERFRLKIYKAEFAKGAESDADGWNDVYQAVCGGCNWMSDREQSC